LTIGIQPATPTKIASPKKEIHVHEPIEIVDDEKPIPKPAKEEPKSTKKPEAKVLSFDILKYLISFFILACTTETGVSLEG